MGDHPKEELAKFKRILLYFAVLEPIVSKYGDFRKKTIPQNLETLEHFFHMKPLVYIWQFQKEKKSLKSGF